MPIREADFGRPFGIVALMILALLFVSEVASEFVDGQHGGRASAGEVRMRRGIRRISRSYYVQVSPNFQTVKENENVEFYCTVSGVTNYYHVTWERQGGKMPHNARTLGRTLSLTNVGKEDAGNYECVVHVWGRWTLRTSPGTLRVMYPTVQPTTADPKDQEPLIVKWSRWGPFSDCSHTCGGGRQVRTRTCDVTQGRVPPGQPSPTCAGKPLQNRTCADWACPDCTAKCPRGTLNPTCDACTCDTHVLSGRVLTKDGAPVAGADISLENAPYIVLAKTDTSGKFRAGKVCAESQGALVRKDGFVPARVTTSVKSSTEATLRASLELAAPPSITVHPVSKKRIAGQRVTFCCKAHGNPPPNIEWFWNGNILDTEESLDEGSLQIEDVRDVNGSYQCRAINDFGAEFSDAAVLTVLGPTEDTCNPTPRTKNLTLPEGCAVKDTEQRSVNVGKCPPASCLRNDSVVGSSCRDTSFCCAPKEYIDVEIQCALGKRFTVRKIANCGCADGCKREETFLEGRVTGPDGEPMIWGDVLVGGKPMTWTDENGHFSIRVQPDTRRMAVSFVDFDERLETITKVFKLQEGQTNFYKVVLPVKEPPITFSAAEPVDIPLGHSSDNQTSFAEVEIPENALLTEDGEAFSGQANVRVSVTDPRNRTDVQRAPGDFSAVGEEGEEQMLQTVGMMQLNFEDPESKKPLSLSKPFKIYLDPEQVNLTIDENGNVSAKLYWLDEESGRWREAGNMWAVDGSTRRRKRDTRRFIVAEVLPSMSKRRINCDVPSRVAVARVRAEAGSIVRVIRAGSNEYAEQVVGNDGTICVRMWGDSVSYMQVEKDGVLLQPDGNFANFPPEIDAQIVPGPEDTGIRTLQFTSWSRAQDDDGPLYPLAEESKCTRPDRNDQDPRRNFVFRPGNAAPAEQEYDVKRMIPDEGLWNSNGPQQRCYIKIRIRANNKLSFIAESFAENNWGRSFGSTTGTSIPVTGSPGEYVLCLEYRCSRAPQNGLADFTYVVVSPLTGRCKNFNRDRDMDSNLLAGQTAFPQCRNAGGRSREQVTSFCIPDDLSGRSSYGTYVGALNGRGDDDLAWKGCLMSRSNPTARDIYNGGNPRRWRAEENTRSDENTLSYDCT